MDSAAHCLKSEPISASAGLLVRQSKHLELFELPGGQAGSAGSRGMEGEDEADFEGRQKQEAPRSIGITLAERGRGRVGVQTCGLMGWTGYCRRESTSLRAL